jgi:hypothetical protein
MLCFTHDGQPEPPLSTPAQSTLSDLAASRPVPTDGLGDSYTYSLAHPVKLADASASPAAAAAGTGYVPLAPVSSPVWTTGYFLPTGTVDLQAGATAAPDVSAGEAASLPRNVPINANGLPLLESQASGQGLEIFLDFARNADGRGTFSLDSDRDNFSLTEQQVIYACWRNIVGFFAQFNVNVTTVLPPTGAADPNFAWLQITNEFDGGAAYVGWLSKDGPKGTVNSGNAVSRVSGLAHEIGHLLGLNHQANFDKYTNLTAEYTNGDGYRNVPVMGIDYNGTPSSRWWYGRESNGTAGAWIQDDVQVIANTCASVAGGDGFRSDDYGNTLASAFTLAAGSQQFDAFTERYSDTDVFKITPTTAGQWNITATPLYSSQAQPKLELLDAGGNVIAARDDATQRNGPTNEQFFNLSLNPGTYYVRVSSGGDYDEIGYYKLAATQLPNDFISDDIGVPAVGGSVTYDPATQVFTQSGGGTDIWNTSDQFRFTYQALPGDGTITARVDALDNIGFYTKAGVMIRQSLAANSPFGYLGLIPSGAVESIWRSATGIAAQNVATTGNAGPWVQIKRTGNVLSYARSADGTTCSPVGTTTLATGPVLIGLATSAWSSKYEAFATFSNVSVSGNVTPAAPTYNLLPAPVTFTAAPAAGANTSINLSWSPVVGATGYRIERSVNGIDFSTLTSVGSGATSYTDTNVWGSMRWFYRVAAADGTSLYSPPATANAVNKPNAPVLTSYTAGIIGRGTTELDFNWLDVQGEVGYRVEGTNNNGATWTVLGTTGANQTSFNATGLIAATPHQIRITPLTVVGDGVAPPLVLSTETRMPAPATFRFTAKTSTSMAIAWDGYSAINEQYRVERSTDGMNWTFLGDTAANGTTWTDNNVTAGGEYYYRVMPWDATFNGDMSGAIFAAAPAASMPSGWSNADVGSVAGTGTAGSGDGSSWSTVSGGYDVAGNADALNFTYRALTTDATILARVNTVEPTANAAKAGLMIRQDLTAGSKFAAIMLNAGGGYGIDLRSRTVANAGYTYQSALGNVTAPYWLRLARSGNTVVASYSADGSSFTTAATINLSLSGTFYVGMAVSSFSTTQLNTSTFTNVAVGTNVPTVATPASANPNPVTAGTSTNLSVLGADTGGESSLTYTWSATGPGAVTYSANGTNHAKNTTATFSAAGSYTFTATIANAGGLVTTSSVSVTVNAVLTAVSIAPVTIGVSTGRQLTGTAVDQFGNAMTSQPALTWSLLNGVGSITAAGLYTAPAGGLATAQVKATTGSASGTGVVNVVAAGEEVAWYKFNEAGGTTAFDSSGRNRHATLTGAAAFAAGTSGNALGLSGGSASLPAGVVSSLTGDFTIATWVKLNSIDTWSRIFDFGTGTGVYMFVTPAAGGTNLPRFAITTGSSGGEQVVNSSTAIATNTWTHVAVRLSGSTATLYINGTAVGSNSGVTLRPSSLGNTTQNYIGKSQWADPALKGSVDDFRIYARALSTSEITALSAQPRFAYVFDNRLYVDFSGSPISLGVNGSGNVTVTQGATTLTFAPATFADILVTGSASADALTQSNTLPKPVLFAGGGASDSLLIASGASATFNADLAQLAPSLSVQVDGTATFNASQRLASLTVAGSAAVSPGGGKMLTTAGLGVTGTLDIGDGSVLVNAGDAGSLTGGAYTGIAGLGAAGRITTSRPAAQGGNPVMRLGVSASGSDVKVLYTYAGDADLNGKLDGDDYFILDSHALPQAIQAYFGWWNGDFDYNGKINGDDYFILDSNLGRQGVAQ